MFYSRFQEVLVWLGFLLLCFSIQFKQTAARWLALYLEAQPVIQSVHIFQRLFGETPFRGSQARAGELLGWELSLSWAVMVGLAEWPARSLALSASLGGSSPQELPAWGRTARSRGCDFPGSGPPAQLSSTPLSQAEEQLFRWLVGNEPSLESRPYLLCPCMCDRGGLRAHWESDPNTEVLNMSNQRSSGDLLR